MRWAVLAMLCVLVHPLSTFADVTNVTITSRAVVADGHAFGAADRTNADRPYRVCARFRPTRTTAASSISNTRRAPAMAACISRPILYVLRPVDPAKGNGVLLFEVANRGNKGLLTTFNRDAARSDDPSTLADFGDGLLMRDGYTLVLLGWEFGLKPPLSRP